MIVSFLDTLNQIIVLFLLLITGFAMRKLNIVDASFSKNLSRFLFCVIIPARIIDAMDYPFSMSTLMASGQLLLIGLCIAIFAYLLSIFVVKALNLDPLSRNIYQFAVIFPNFGFMGYPVVEAIFGEEAVFYAVIFNIVNYILVNSFGIMLIKRGEAKRIKADFKNVINPPIVAVLLGILFFVFPLNLPVPISKTIEMIGMTTSPLSMMLAGLILANAKFSTMFFDVKVYIVSFIRLIVIPSVVMLMLKQFGLEPLTIGIAVTISAMPIAANTSILAERYDSNAYLAAQCVFMSTLLSIITIPIIAYFL